MLQQNKVSSVTPASAMLADQLPGCAETDPQEALACAADFPPQVLELVVAGQERLAAKYDQMCSQVVSLLELLRGIHSEHVALRNILPGPQPTMPVTGFFLSNSTGECQPAVPGPSPKKPEHNGATPPSSPAQPFGCMPEEACRQSVGLHYQEPTLAQDIKDMSRSSGASSDSGRRRRHSPDQDQDALVQHGPAWVRETSCSSALSASSGASGTSAHSGASRFSATSNSSSSAGAERRRSHASGPPSPSSSVSSHPPIVKHQGSVRTVEQLVMENILLARSRSNVSRPIEDPSADAADCELADFDSSSQKEVRFQQTVTVTSAPPAPTAAWMAPHESELNETPTGRSLAGADALTSTAATRRDASEARGVSFSVLPSSSRLSSMCEEEEEFTPRSSHQMSFIADDRRSSTSTPRAALNDLREARNLKLMTMSKGQQSQDESQHLRWRRLFLIPRKLLAVLGTESPGEGRLAYLLWCLAIVLPVLGLSGSLVRTFMDPDHLLSSLVTVCYAASGLVGLVLVRQRLLHNALVQTQPLRSHASMQGFEDLWLQQSMTQFLVAMVAWMCMVSARCGSVFAAKENCGPAGCEGRLWEELLDLALFACGTGLFALLVYLVLHRCCGLELTMDHFSVESVSHVDYARMITEWNVVQALMRHEASNVDWCFLSLGTSTVMTILLVGVGVIQEGKVPHHMVEQPALGIALWYGSILPPILLLLYAVLRAAKVTEVCLRVPSLLNSWNVEEGAAIDHDRLHAVQHMTLSAAGFYVCGVRLSASVALKFVYIVGAVLFTFASRAMLYV